MGIYRGAGGSGDAVNDASSEALITIQARDAALAAQAAAEAAQTAAELAETNAETAETNAETAETNAETAATNAAASASAASTSASNAASSASAASTSASNASTSASNAASSASAASTSASNASTSATNAANSATSASNSASTATTQATNASNSASAASTSATNAASSATAAAGSATNAASSATSASGSASTATTQATNAANSATAAATSATNASNSASAASTSATNASNSASAAATSATNASNSASAASTSATNASNSATSAANSATAAAASYDSFDDRYLGAKSSAPTLDNDGNTLLTGALYYDTVSSSMKVWSGSAWLDAYASLSGALLATNNLSDLNNTATARTNLGVAIGVNVQAYDAQLADIAGLTPTDNNFIVGNGTNFVTESGSTARTSLGLGSIATQDANNVAVTGGSINGTTIGASTPSTGSFTSLTDSGNLTFTGTGNRITGDFSTATDTNRVSFQTSTANSITSVSILPNGTGTTSNIRAFNNSDPTNAAFGSIGAAVNGTEIRLQSAITGTGTYLPLTMYTGGSERLRIDTSGRLGVGTTSPSALVHPSGSDAGSYQLGVSGTTKGFRVVTSSTTTKIQGVDNTLSASYQPFTLGGSYLSFETNGTTEAMRIASSGNVGIGTSSPVQALEISSTNAGSISWQRTGVAAKKWVITSDNSGTYFSNSTDSVFNVLTLANAGNVGIGTDSPARRLHLYASATCDMTIQAGNTTDYSYLYFGDSTSATQAWIGYYHTEDSMRFATNAAERMRITSTGRVGIGISSPLSPLHIVTTTGAANDRGVIIQDRTVGNGGEAWLSFKTQESVDDERIKGAIVYANAGSDYGRGNLLFCLNNANDNANATLSDERMRITSGGLVGIATSSPDTNLTVDTASGVGNTVNQHISLGRGTSVRAYIGTNKDNATDNVSGLVFGINSTERMRIDSSGNVGIGTSSVFDSNTRLELSKSGNCQQFISSTDASGVRIYLSAQGSTSANFGAFSNHPLSFRTNDTERGRFDTSGNFLFNSGYGSVATAYGCRAWVNFNGSGTVSIRASGNVSSITDNGTGDYTVNFTNAMPNTNYSVSGSCGRNGSAANANILSVADNTSAPTTSAVRVNTRGDNGTSTDIDLVSVMVYR